MPNNTSLFNADSTAYETGVYPIFLGENCGGLHDSINRNYPELFRLYKLQKERDWYENEIPLHQSRMDIEDPDNAGLTDLIIKNIAFQWELDTIASRGIAPVIAPFSTNSEHWLAVVKQTEIENLHWLTYAEIVKNCVPDTRSVFHEVMKNKQVLNRAHTVVRVMDEVERMGAEYKLGLIKADEKMMGKLLVFYVALFALEAIQFMSSFAVTFAVAGKDKYQGIAQFVQKIMSDEQLHAMMDKETIRAILTDPVWRRVFKLPEVQNEIKSVLDEVMSGEHEWNRYILSDGRACPGLSIRVLDQWNAWRAAPVYDFLGVQFDHERPKFNPLPFMDDWMDIDSNQNANQEQGNNNYVLISLTNDIGDKVLSVDW